MYAFRKGSFPDYVTVVSTKSMTGHLLGGAGGIAKEIEFFNSMV